MPFGNGVGRTKPKLLKATELDERWVIDHAVDGHPCVVLLSPAEGHPSLHNEVSAFNELG